MKIISHFGGETGQRVTNYAIASRSGSQLAAGAIIASSHLTEGPSYRIPFTLYCSLSVIFSKTPRSTVDLRKLESNHGAEDAQSRLV